MEDSSSSELDKTRSGNAWDDARILTHVANIGKTHNLAHLRFYNPDVMTTRPYNRNPVDTENDSYYSNTDKASLDYLRAGNTLPYSINTLHLQNPYKPPQRAEGFAFRDNSKGMYRSHDFILRSRHNNNNLVTKKESVANRNSDQENEKTERSKKKNQRCTDCMQFLKQYSENTSLHGLRYVGDSSLSPIERIFWLISFIAALVTAVYYIWYLYRKWVNEPIIIALSPEPISLTEFPFPSVTICNMNHIKKTEAMRIERGSDTMDKLLMDDICNVDTNTSYGIDSENIEWERMERFMINASQPCTDMLYYCLWHGNETDCDSIFNPIMTDEGICCNFNSVNRKYLFYNPRDWPDLNITYPAISVDWNAETGYDANTTIDVIPQRPHGTGLLYGLTLVLDVEEDEYYCTSTTSAGFKMLLHNPVETPKIADFSFALTPGKETRVIVRPRISVADSRIISISEKKRKCFFTKERKLRYYRTYTQRNCILECEANFTREICGCVQYYMPKSANTPICGQKDSQCAANAKRAMELRLYDEDPLSMLNVSKIPNCLCWPACFEINYRIQLSQSKLIQTYTTNKNFVKKDTAYFM